jgi:hypothetical protein
MKYDTIFGFFLVTKFQTRGCEHDHGILWVANGPTCGSKSNKIIEFFVD